MGKGFWFSLKRTYLEIVKPPASNLALEDYPDLTSTVALVTGASAGIGIETAKLLASKNCLVLMGVRNKSKGVAARDKILNELGENGGNPVGQLELIMMDLADLETLKTVPGQISSIVQNIDIIIHNAGVASPSVPLTKQGFEGINGVNSIGTFFLQKQLDEFFFHSSESPYKRIVWLSSAAHHVALTKGGLDWDKLLGKKPFKDMTDSYSQSKIANMYMSYYWGVVHKKELAENDKILSLNAHPGLLASEVHRDEPITGWIINKFAYPAIYGAFTELYAALGDDLNSKDHQGAYICPWGVVGEMRDDVKEGVTDGNSKKLWDWLEEVTSKY